MPRLIDLATKEKKELLPMTVAKARQGGWLPQGRVVVERDGQGYNRQLTEEELLIGDYILIPRNKAGAR